VTGPIIILEFVNFIHQNQHIQLVLKPGDTLTFGDNNRFEVILLHPRHEEDDEDNEDYNKYDNNNEVKKPRSFQKRHDEEEEDKLPSPKERQVEMFGVASAARKDAHANADSDAVAAMEDEEANSVKNPIFGKKDIQGMMHLFGKDGSHD
jgi:hypothetical protein